MIKAIIFDVGGTYMTGSMIDFVNHSYKILGINKTFTATEEIIFDEKFNKGLIDYKTCFANYFKVPITNQQMEKIKKIWTTTWVPSREMIELVKSLQNNYTLAILSNSDPLNSKKYAKKGWYDYFDYLILSHEVGILKPNQKIYQITLKKLNLPANQCLFIDDQKKVLIPAKKIGMRTILFKSLPQLKKELNSMNIKHK